MDYFIKCLNKLFKFYNYYRRLTYSSSKNPVFNESSYDASSFRPINLDR
jgi:hypothetical protein